MKNKAHASSQASIPEHLLTKAEIKLIHSLARKKQRDEYGLFIAEGPKVVSELNQYFTVSQIIATNEWQESFRGCSNLKVVSADIMQRCSLMQAPQGVMAVFKKPRFDAMAQTERRSELLLALDGVQDPGNLGTILRTADWMGIPTIYASPDTADCFAPKVVQATMGALGRVKIIYAHLPTMLPKLTAKGYHICGTFMEGQSLYEATLKAPLCIVMGNEGRGIRPDVAACCQKRLTIPRYVPASDGSESLNVAIATAIVCSELKRQQIG